MRYEFDLAVLSLGDDDKSHSLEDISYSFMIIAVESN
jgi:hypothetical protein